MKMKQAELAATLRAMAQIVEDGASFEGCITYSCMREGLEPGQFAVEGCYRIGNDQGQGGMRVMGPEDWD